MKQILEELKRGNTKMVTYFAAADNKWKELLSDSQHISIEKLAARISAAQSDFERLCESAYLGKKIMPWSGFAHLYNCETGYDDKAPLAKKLSQAFAISACSIEVKVWAEDAAKIYHIEDPLQDAA